MLVDEIRKRTEEKVAYHKQQEIFKTDALEEIKLIERDIGIEADMGRREKRIEIYEHLENYIVKYFQEQGFKLDSKLGKSLITRHLTISW